MAARQRKDRGRSPSPDSPVVPEAYILSGSIEPRCATDCLKGCLTWNNETVNIWSHILGAVTNICFLIVSVVDMQERKRQTDEDVTSSMITRLYLPLIMHGVGSTAVLLASSCAHCFHRLSGRIHNIAFTFDYAGIGLYSIASAVAHCYYSRPAANQPFGSLFAWPLPYIAIATIAHTYVFLTITSLRIGKKVSNHVRKILLVAAYALSYFVNFAPFLARSLFCKSFSACSEIDRTYWFHWLQAGWSLVGGFLVAAQIPERIWPGKFDLIGNGHQLMHFAICASMWYQWKALRMDLNTRWDELSHATAQPDPVLVFAAPCVYLTAALAFMYYAFRKKVW